jgi:hypothetical protein
VNTALFAVFTASFFHPRTGRDWRAMSAFTAFLLALFTEMYGIPLTRLPAVGMAGLEIPGPTGHPHATAQAQPSDDGGRSSLAINRAVQFKPHVTVVV